MTLKIATASDGETAVLRLSGQIEEDHLAQLDVEIRRYRPRLVFDLAEATLVDRAAVQFLAAREGEGIELVNCPRYIREWITQERDSVGPEPWLTVHSLNQEDSVGARALRASVAAFKGKLVGTAARAPFDDLMERVAAPADVTFEADTVGGISGFWAKPARSRKGAVILHLHGGWFNLGSAHAYRNFVGHIASSAGTATFIPDYRLAPEHPFPAAVTDVNACYRGLVDQGIDKIAVVGDSAGGNLALVLVSTDIAPVGAVAISPVTDLALTGESYATRAEADPYFTKSQVAGLVASYLGPTDSKNPLASPLYGDLRGLPPIRVHVGDDEVLLDDSRRYVERAVAAGVDVRLDIWIGMPHGFVTAVREFDAARQSLKAIGAFLTERLL